MTLARILTNPGIDRRRRMKNNVMTTFVYVAVGLAILPLLLILGAVVVRGAPVLTINFFTKLPTPVGVPGGGIANAILGSFIMVGLVSFIAVPIGVGAGVFFSEWPESRLSALASFLNDV